MNKGAPQFLVAFSKNKVCGVLETVWYFLFLTFEGPTFVADIKNINLRNAFYVFRQEETSFRSSDMLHNHSFVLYKMPFIA